MATETASNAPNPDIQVSDETPQVKEFMSFDDMNLPNDLLRGI
jgi:hypothetical protein